jgi:CRISPR-associated protein Csx10
MNPFRYKVTLVSDIVITANSASEGPHEGLDYIPGSVFLGVVAGAIVRSDNKFPAEMLLSGNVRFLDAQPLLGDSLGYPVPLNYHRRKNDTWGGRAPVTPRFDGNGDEQYVQAREGYVTEDGRMFKPVKEYRLKTAVDRDRRASKDGQMFGYESIPAGTEYVMAVQSDSLKELQEIDNLLNKQEVRLGRSRSAEYGTAQLTRLENNTAAAPQSEPLNDGRICFYLLSDLAISRNGMPVLMPSAADFGLPENAELDLENTFVRSRKYSPWNSYFNCRMSERQVLVRGSVISFKNCGTVNPEKIADAVSAGIGLYREEGLGQVLVNPRFVVQPPEIQEIIVEDEPNPQENEPQTPVVKFAKLRMTEKQHALDDIAKGKELGENWYNIMKAISKRHGAQYVPGKTQWKNVRQKALALRHDRDQLTRALEYLTHALRKMEWNEKEVDKKTLYGHLIEKSNEERFGYIFAHAAAEVISKMTTH